ncbi:MAG: TonB-dependent receptor [Puniceicoccaceae bacterium]|nr:MAG: TonB-dependent receptor [Puniceicoccaceae bacterium]
MAHLCIFASLVFAPVQLSAQDVDDDIYVLSPFDVRTEGDAGYRKTNAVTAIRIGAPIIETPFSISVIPRELIDDLDIRNNNELFFYTEVDPMGWTGAGFELYITVRR